MLKKDIMQNHNLYGNSNTTDNDLNKSSSNFTKGEKAFTLFQTFTLLLISVTIILQVFMLNRPLHCVLCFIVVICLIFMAVQSKKYGKKSNFSLTIIWVANLVVNLVLMLMEFCIR